MIKLKISVGDRFWRLKVLWETKNKFGKRVAICRCDCWRETTPSPRQLIKWWTESCWCKQYEDARKNNTKHWMTWWWSWKPTRFYTTYCNIKNRCSTTNTTKDYENYWWRWIRCERNNFEDFKYDMYDSYLKHVKEFWEKETEIDRINVNLNYYKENCRWVTEKEQSRNRRNNILVEYKWIMYCLSDLADILWIKRRTFYNLYHKYWNITNVLASKLQ